jgi:hypothetical protein
MKQRAMSSRFKNMPGVAWLVIGVCVTALVLPSAAYATGTLKFVGIEGSNLNKASVTASGQLNTEAGIQGTSGSHADVTGNNELMTRNSNPGDIYQTTGIPVAGIQPIATPPVNRGLLVSDLHVAVAGGSGTGAAVIFFVSAVTCSQPGLPAPVGGNWKYSLFTPNQGETDVPFAPALPIPNGDQLCSEGISGVAGSLSADVAVTGESVPASEFANFNYSPGT